MSGELRFEVHGKPRPKGSMRVVGPHGRGGMKESNPESAPWREAVKWAAMRAVATHEHATGEPFTLAPGPVEVVVVFSFAKPASAPKTIETFPITRSTYDVDKLLRNINDALVDAGAIHDDSRVVRIVGEKAYCGAPPSHMALPGAAITVRPYVSGGEHAQL